MKKFTDIEIIESVKRGNTSDFALLVDRYKNKAFPMLKRMLKNEMDAEEALQDAFLKAFNGLKSFRADSKFSTWFYRIAYNTGLTALAGKDRKVNREMLSVEDIYDFGIDDKEIYAKSDSGAEYLYSVLNKLPPRNSVILILYYIDGLTLNEISGVMDISLVNCKVLLHRSRNILRDALLKHNYQEELL